MPIGTDSRMPATVEVSVIVRLSTSPWEMSRQRVVKSGARKPCTKRQPRSMPSATRPQSTVTVDSASAR